MDLFRFDPPDLTDAEARRIADDLYGVTGETLHLRGERSHNTRFTAPEGDQYVLRVASASELDEVIEFNALALVHLEQQVPELPIARMLPARTGQLVPAIERDGERHRVRLETYLPGLTFDDDQIVSLAALTAIGELLGKVAVGLAEFFHPGGAGFMPWNIANGLIDDAHLRTALPADAARLIDRAQTRIDAASRTMRRLPRQIVHNDGHAGNLLRADRASERVTGLIDFGDLVHTVTVADIAVAGASFVPHQPDPVAALAALTAGYASQRPLRIDEVMAIPDLVLARLVLSTLLIQYQLTNAPHMVEAVAPERESTLANLARWLKIDPDVAVRGIEEQL
jgi:hydroxylysine kinase